MNEPYKRSWDRNFDLLMVIVTVLGAGLVLARTYIMFRIGRQNEALVLGAAGFIMLIASLWKSLRLFNHYQDEKKRRFISEQKKRRENLSSPCLGVWPPPPSEQPYDP